MSDDACRIDVWLWRARFFKTRTRASRFIDEGRVRLTRQAKQARVEKPAHPVKSGDLLVFAVGGRLTTVRVAALGMRRGSPTEARALYEPLPDDAG
jgi:ribosomal 50S subunit-recycling heat shock protein